jgi:hypothetical protein
MKVNENESNGKPSCSIRTDGRINRHDDFFLFLLLHRAFYFNLLRKPTNALKKYFKKHTLKHLKAPTFFGLRPSSGGIHGTLLIINVEIIRKILR